MPKTISAEDDEEDEEPYMFSHDDGVDSQDDDDDDYYLRYGAEVVGYLSTVLHHIWCYYANQSFTSDSCCNLYRRQQKASMGGTTQWLSSMNPFVPKTNIRGKRDTTNQQQQPASIRYLVSNIEF